MNQTVRLHDNWQIARFPADSRLTAEELKSLCQGGEAGRTWYPAKAMPAQVHDILLENGVIENEALKGRCDRYAWVAEADWVYRCVFAAPQGSDRALLRLKGLDTLVDAYLNGEPLFSHQSMYRAAELEVGGRLREENTLLLHFHSPFPFLDRYEQPENHTHEIKPMWALRKCTEDFSRYLGAQPKQSVPIGVFDDIELVCSGSAWMGWLDLEADLNHTLDHGVVDGAAELLAACPGRYTLTARLLDPNGVEVSRAESEAGLAAGGSASLRFSLGVNKPALWWPNGLGEHPLYTVEVALADESGALETTARQIGFRRVECRAVFDFYVNGKAVKLWGGNFAPLGKEGISHVYDAEKALRVLDLVENGMNCMRVWGPGVPYPAALYEECDRRGILLWQEFYGHSLMYPETAEYYAECKADAEELVRRLKHHASLLLWCGGNESIMWADIEDPNQHVYGKSLYFDEYRRVCEKLDPKRVYYPTCPMYGSYPNDPKEGDTHGLEHRWWHVPGCDYPYFFSENTRVSPSSMKSLLRFMTKEEIWPEGYSAAARPGDLEQIPPAWIYYSAEAGNAMWDKFGPVERFYTPTNAEELVYTIAAARALHFHEAVGRCRRGRPHYERDQKRRSFGHLVWKLNDTLPQIYSAVIDYYAEPYIPYYAMVRAYQPVLISFELDDSIHAWVVNDSGRAVRGTLTVRVFDVKKNAFVEGQTLSREVRAEHDEAIRVCDLDSLGMIWRQNILFATLTAEDGGIIAEATEFLTMERYFDFPNATLTLREEDGAIVVTTDRFAHSVELAGDFEGDQDHWLFSDNYFDLIPGVEKRITLKGRHHKGVVTAKAMYSDDAATLTL